MGAPAETLGAALPVYNIMHSPSGLVCGPGPIWKRSRSQLTCLLHLCRWFAAERSAHAQAKLPKLQPAAGRSSVSDDLTMQALSLPAPGTTPHHSPFSATVQAAGSAFHFRGMQWSSLPAASGQIPVDSGQLPAALGQVPAAAEQAPRLLLLHGFLGAAQDWFPIAAALSITHHVLALDLPGHGGTRAEPLNGEHTTQLLTSGLA